MQPDEFHTLAIELFGEQWPSVIAHRLAVNKATVKKYARGKLPVPDAVQSIMKFWRDAGQDYEL